MSYCVLLNNVSVAANYGKFILLCHSILKILEYTYELLFRNDQLLLLKKLTKKLKIIINLALLQQLIFYEHGWNIFSVIYYAPVLGHLWLEMKMYYGMSF